MMSPLLVFQWLIFCFHVLSTCSTADPFDIPRLSPINPRKLYDHQRKLISKIANSSDFQEKFYTQTLDHFNYKKESYQTFQQRYFIYSKYWDAASSRSTFFVYLGAEAPLAVDQIPYYGGLLLDYASQFNASVIFIEHRFYGKSSPLGSQEDALKNESLRGYFNSAQALADFAEIIIGIKKKFSAPTSPVIVFGGSYGGMLASWFRLKYPHVALGALASSAPILGPLNDANELKDDLIWIYADAAQYDNPPTYPVSVICNAIDGAASSGKDIFEQILNGLYAYYAYYYDYSGTQRSCYFNPNRNQNYDETVPQQEENYDETRNGWGWQICSEMLGPFGSGYANDSMFQPYPYDRSGTIQDCKAKYGVDPRPDWITDYYGGHDMELTLKRFGSNIIFSNGLRDPYSAGGVLKNISDTIVAVTTVNGSHAKDLDPTDYSTDPVWLIQQRVTEMKIIRTWIDTYYNDLRMIKPSVPTFF